MNSKKEEPSTDTSNVFGGDDDDEDDEDLDVNQQIKKEQDALRKRAERAAALNPNAATYDFDGTYDATKKSDEDQKDNDDANKKKEKQGSKYIQDLLKASNERKREREIIYERKMAKEQQHEELDNPNEYQGKEKFITSSYKRKLEERNAWISEDKRRQIEESENDISKKQAGDGASSSGMAFANFYGNVLGSSTNGGKSVEEEDDKETPERNKEQESHDDDDFDFVKPGGGGGGMGFLSGFAQADEDDELEDEREKKKSSNGDNMDAGGGDNTGVDNVEKDDSDSKKENLSIREIRNQKVAEARIRYLARKEKQ